jgi:transposase
MARRSRIDPKIDALKERGALNPNPDRVKDALFQGSDFFDPRDRVQVKYEMIRRARVDTEPVSQVTRGFGVSRPTFYQTESAFDREGLPGLLPKKRGPRGGHKLKLEVIDYLQECLRGNESLDSTQLARLIKKRFHVRVHPRSVERGLDRQKKKRRRGSTSLPPSS